MNQDEMTLCRLKAFTAGCNKIPPAPFYKGGEIKGRAEGFTLVEVIVTIVAAGILGAIFINFMGTAMSRSTRSVLNVEAEANAQRLLEQIVSDYAVEINGANFSAALETIRKKTYPINDYLGAAIDSRRYINFDSNGNHTVLPADTTSGDTLKITVVWKITDAQEAGGTAITTLLTKSRKTAGDPAVAF